MSVVRTIQQAIADAIKADAFFKNVDVVTSDPGDVQADVETALAKLGLCVVVEVMRVKINHPGVGSGSASIVGAITIEESVLLNRGADGSGKTAFDAMERVYAVLSPVKFAGGSVPCLLGDAELINDVGGRIAFQIAITSNAGFEETAD